MADRRAREQRRWLAGLWSLIFSTGAWRRGLGPRFLFVFVVGVGVGFGLATLLHFPFDLHGISGKVALHHHTLTTFSPNFTTEVVTNASTTGIIELHHTFDINSSFAEKLLTGMQEVAARKLAREVRVLCWVMTYPRNHKSKAFHVKATWGRHCNLLIFASEVDDPELPAVKLNVRNGRNGLWAKTVEAFAYMYQHHRDDYDWVMKADDDTYVMVENLRSMLLPYKPFEPHYFGFQYKPHTPMGYMSGGGGYVLSKESVDRVVTKAFYGQHKDCPDENNTNAEDINIGKCLHAVGVRVGDSRDALGRNRFFPFDVEDHINPEQGKNRWWYTDYRYWPIKGGMDCCSDKPVSFHYVSPTKMYMLEFLVYHVNAFPVMNLVTAAPVTDPTTPTTTSATNSSSVSKQPTTQPMNKPADNKVQSSAHPTAAPQLPTQSPVKAQTQNPAKVQAQTPAKAQGQNPVNAPAQNPTKTQNQNPPKLGNADKALLDKIEPSLLIKLLKSLKENKTLSVV